MDQAEEAKTQDDGHEYTKGDDMVDLPPAYQEVAPPMNFEPSKEAHHPPKSKRKMKLCKMILLIIIALLFAGGVVVASLTFWLPRNAEKSVPCNRDVHNNVHKGQVIYDNETGRIIIECDHGYKLIGSPVVECLSSGHWSQTPTCVSKECKNLPVPDHGFVDLNTTTSSILKHFKVRCHEGYFPEGNQTVVCQSDETWSPVPVCKLVDCGDPKPIANAKSINLGATTFTETFQVECNEGYYLDSGNETVTCESDGKWDELPVCSRVSCGLPTRPDHSRIETIIGHLYGDSAKLTCIEGYEMHGDLTLTCQSDGKWSAPPVCSPVNCGMPPRINNGKTTDHEDTVYNSVFNVDCNYGYILKGSRSVRCESSGKWGHIPECERISCGVPTVPPHAYVSNSRGTKYGDTLTFHCSSGYDMSGERTVICQANGHWTKSPTCYDADPCYPNPCYHGTCVASGYGYSCVTHHASGSSGLVCESLRWKIWSMSLLLLVAFFGKSFMTL